MTSPWNYFKACIIFLCDNRVGHTLAMALCTIFTILLTLWNSEQKNGLLIKLFCFSSDFNETWESCTYPCVIKFHQVSSKSNEKQKSFINSPFFCSEFQCVSRIVKIVHSGLDTYRSIWHLNGQKLKSCGHPRIKLKKMFCGQET